MRRVVTKTPFGSYTTIEGDDILMPSPQELLDIAWGYNSLSKRVDENIRSINKLHAKEDASLEDIASVFHSLIHKVTEGITNGDYKQARRAYTVLQEAIPKFGLPD